MPTSARSGSHAAQLAPVRPPPAQELQRLRDHPGRAPREPFRIIIARDPRHPLKSIAIPARLPAILLGVLGTVLLAALGFGVASYYLRDSVDRLRTRMSAMSDAADHLARHPLPAGAAPPLDAEASAHEGPAGARVRPEKAIPAERLGRFQLESVNTGEQMEVRLDLATGEPDEGTYRSLRRFMRCLRTTAETPIDPRLIDILHAIARRTGRQIQLVSGFRAPMFSTAKFSYHARGMAADIRIPGMTALMVRDLVASMGVRGVGYYPKSQFVHVDVRDQRYHWIDHGPPNDDEESSHGAE